MEPDYLVLLPVLQSAAALVLLSCHNLCVSPSEITNSFSMDGSVRLYARETSVCHGEDRNAPCVSSFLSVQGGEVTAMVAVLCPPLL